MGHIESYETHVLAEDAGDMQRACTKRAFFGGATAMLSEAKEELFTFAETQE